MRVPKDIEQYLFKAKLDLTKYNHNKQLTNATQSQQHVMDLIDKKFDKLKSSLYKLGIKPKQFKEMVESQSLFEWSPEVAIALGLRFCSQVIQEDDNEDLDTKRSLSGDWDEHKVEETDINQMTLIPALIK